MREAGPPNHLDDEVDSDQYVVNEELSLCLTSRKNLSSSLGVSVACVESPAWFRVQGLGFRLWVELFVKQVGEEHLNGHQFCFYLSCFMIETINQKHSFSHQIILRIRYGICVQSEGSFFRVINHTVDNEVFIP